MKLCSPPPILALSWCFSVALAADSDCPSKWICYPTSSAPKLDADLSEWTLVEGIETPLKGIGGNDYAPGAASYKCMYDATHIYFAFAVPGFYRFGEEDNHHCASIGTMMKVGVDATFLNMGGCPLAMSPSVTCDSYLLQKCHYYRVDVGAHWELKTTQQGVKYEIGSKDTAAPGNDLKANKDDEFGVSSYCRKDDNDMKAGNEWAGAWAHSNPLDGELGTYTFELSRLLQTSSTVSDGQFEMGGTYQFGVAFWDPVELESGWTDAGHYLTGCGQDWIDLELIENARSLRHKGPL